METIGSKRSYALIWCMPNNDDDDVHMCACVAKIYHIVVLQSSVSTRARG